ncbi:recombinase family protein [Umezawaea sp.]|uniref:recombinase family protein n=1 Tax=Umezawaea sp. TaxID=1955258 RepID=UPI002ED199F7
MTTAREYLRVSKDKSGHQRSNEEQHADHEALADARGWSLGKPYQDVVSASRYSAKVRGGFAELIADLHSGEFAASVLLLWESSRGSRQVGEWVELIGLCEKASVMIHVTAHDRTYDPSNPRDRRTILEDAVDSEYEAAKTSTRGRRTAAQAALNGQPWARIPFGYRRTRDPNTGRVDQQEINPEEAEVVRELFARIIAGHSFRGIATDFAERGITRRSGKAFTGRDLGVMVSRVLYMGQRSHKPRAGGPLTISVAAWPGIISEADFLTVQRIISAPERVSTRAGRGTHLLSMIARCDVCDAKLAARTRHGEMAYTCHAAGHVGGFKSDLDVYAEEVIISYLSSEAAHSAINAGMADEKKLAEVRDGVARARRDFDELADQVSAGTLSAVFAARAEPGILARLRAAEQREKALKTPAALQGETGPREWVQARWDVAPMAARRTLAQTLFSPDLIGTLRLMRSPTPGKRVPVMDRVVWVRLVDGKEVRVPRGR